MAFLTIDDVPSRLFREKLDYLSSRGLPAIFFIVGNQVTGREAGLVRALKLGYDLGNHSFTHPYFSKLGLEEAREEIEKTDALLSSLYAEADRPWLSKRFRFPYFDLGGPMAGPLQGIIASMGYLGPKGSPSDRHDTDCDFDQREYWLGKPDAPDGCCAREVILARIDACHPAEGDRILIHDHENTHELFFECVDRYLSRGLRFEKLE
jgi:peptidoglycan/xylan/chitin deacetylase (PgdA/CDA1 family)